MGAAVEADQASGVGCGQRRMRLVVGMRPTCSRPTRALFRGRMADQADKWFDGAGPQHRGCIEL
jgi:hypothetical protein